MNKCKNEKEKAITLVALIVTIIILLILAGITIATLTNTGLLNKSKQAEQKSKDAQELENGTLSEYEEEILSASRDTNVTNDLDIEITSIIDASVNEKIDVKQNFENAVYVYILNNKISAYTDKNSYTAENLNGIYGQFYHYSDSDYSSYTSWVYSKITVIYDDNTTSETTTDTLYASGIINTSEPFATVVFEKEKKETEIQMIISEYDSNYGGAYGYIKNIGLIQ